MGQRAVQLIVTGDAEQRALHRSLTRVFPEANFHEPIKLDSFTCTKVPRSPIWEASGVRANALKLADALLGYVKARSAPDLIVLIEDLELDNETQLDVVVDRIRAAVQEVTKGETNAVIEKVRQRCSFHLFAPMLEAYFFGEPAALDRAKAERVSQFASKTCDMEAFSVSDATYLAAPLRSRMKWAVAGRDRHPKCYLQFLCDPVDSAGGWMYPQTTYRETKGGVSALEKLDWQSVLVEPSWTQLARSLFDDLAWGLGVNPVAGKCHPLTCYKSGPGNVLRNI